MGNLMNILTCNIPFVSWKSDKEYIHQYVGKSNCRIRQKEPTINKIPIKTFFLLLD